MSVYLTQEGDVLDRIAHDQMGNVDQAAAILAANPGLASLPEVLPFGVAIILPEREAVPTKGVIRLWGRA